MKCINPNCDANSIEQNDNFCYKCGHWTGKGHTLLNDKKGLKNITNGPVMRQHKRLVSLSILLALSFIIFFVLLTIKGNNLFKPYYYLKKQAFNYVYGYNTSLMKTDNKYEKNKVDTYQGSIDLIKKDFDEQNYYCFNDPEVIRMELQIEDHYEIPSVSFCDMDREEALKIKTVIDKMYSLFPIYGKALTNISITNATKDSNYIARFQPMYQFVNINEDINVYNKVNKTQILLNSYYFLNKDIMSEPIEKTVGENWYVKDATWESTIAHEIGHYISFLTLLRSYKLYNITFETKENENIYKSIIENFNNGNHSMQIVNEALNNYNSKYNTFMTIDSFAESISNYANSRDKDGNLIADETIAEAIHDYFLHRDNANECSLEIVNVIKTKL